MWVAPEPSSATEGPRLKGSWALAAGVPGFGSTIGVESGSEKLSLGAAALRVPPPPGMRSLWPVRTEYGGWMPFAAASSETERLLARAIE